MTCTPHTIKVFDIEVHIHDDGCPAGLVDPPALARRCGGCDGTRLCVCDDPDVPTDAAFAWAEYRKEYGVNPAALSAAHKAFLAGWEASTTDRPATDAPPCLCRFDGACALHASPAANTPEVVSDEGRRWRVWLLNHTGANIDFAAAKSLAEQLLNAGLSAPRIEAGVAESWSFSDGRPCHAEGR